MKKYSNTLNEEIERMKSLFTEERMFGNLITEDVNGDTLEKYEEILTSNNFKKSGPEYGENTYFREFKPYNIVKIKNEVEQRMKTEEFKDFDFNRGSLNFYIMIKVENGLVTSWNSSLSIGPEGKKLSISTGDGYVLSSKEVGKIDAESFKTQLSVALKSDWLKSKTGTNPEFPTNKNASDVKQQRKDDVNATKKEINMSKDECRDHMKDMYKQVRQGKTKEEFQKEEIDGVVWCMSTFRNVFQKEGLFRKGDEIRIMYKTLGLDPTKVMQQISGNDTEEITGDNFDEKIVAGGVEGERYIVKDQNGTKLAIVKKVGANKFNFRSKMNVPLVDKNDKGNIKFRKEYVSYIYKELNIDSNKQRIVIQKAIETDKMDVGSFVLTNV
jgi:hypothetical protein